MKLSLVITIVFTLFIPLGIYLIYNNFFKDIKAIDDTSGEVLPTDLLVVLPSDKNKNIELDNFLSKPGVSGDINNPGSYFLGNTFVADSQSNNSPAYVVVFDAKTKYFNIALLKKPLGQARLEMESYLQKLLNTDKDTMCSLSYSVSVPAYVDEAASGIDYRFSFCANAKPLSS